MVRIRMVVLGSAAALVLAFGGGSALAWTNGGGNSLNTDGLAKAKANCSAAYHTQDGNGVQAGGGPKSAETGPLNCDHYWGAPGKPTP
jgi:hypothetical protein